MNIALHILQSFLQNQLPCPPAISVLLDIAIHVLVTCLVFWDLLSHICCNKLSLPSFPQKTRRICPCSPIQAFEKRKKLHRTICSTFVEQNRKSCRILGILLVGIFCLSLIWYFLHFFLGSQRVTLFVREVKFCICLQKMSLNCRTFCSSLSIKFTEQTKHWARWGIGCDSSFQCQNRVTVSCSSPSQLDRCQHPASQFFTRAAA